MNGFPGVKFSQADKNILRYNISFYCPNPFESPFNDNLAGMREMCTDGDILDNQGHYIIGNLEISEEARKKDFYHQSDWYSGFHNGNDILTKSYYEAPNTAVKPKNVGATKKTDLK